MPYSHTSLELAMNQDGSFTRFESDYLIRLVYNRRKDVVENPGERSTIANAQRNSAWNDIINGFHEKFGKKIPVNTAKNSFKYRKTSLKKNPKKCKMYSEFVESGSGLDSIPEELGIGDYLMFEMYGLSYFVQENSEENQQQNDSPDIVFPSTASDTFDYSILFDDNDDNKLWHEKLLAETKAAAEAQAATESPATENNEAGPVKRIRLDGEIVDDDLQILGEVKETKDTLTIELLRRTIHLVKVQEEAAKKTIEAQAALLSLVERMADRMDRREEGRTTSATVARIMTHLNEAIHRAV